jgi:hypothetical protein
MESKREGMESKREAERGEVEHKRLEEHLLHIP